MAIYIIFAILMFGVLIALHEFGHFLTAKLLGVRVNEFAIGMGPLVWSRQRGETQYSLRAIPMGGFCAMEGEDDASDDPRSFGNKPGWKKFIILVAGSFMNLLTGVLIFLLLFSGKASFGREVVAEFRPDSPLADSQLQVGDRFLAVDGHRVFAYGDAIFFLNRAGDYVDLVVERGGQKVVLDNFNMTRYPVTDDGAVTMLRGLTIGAESVRATPWTRVQMSVYQSIDCVRMVWLSLGDLITGAVGFKEMSGPIGIVNIMGQAGEAGAQAAEVAGTSPMIGAAANILNFTAFIAINLAVMNLLPIPALDGGRIFFLLVNWLFTLVTRKKLDPKYEGYVNMAGFFCLILLMVVVAFNDIVKLFV